MNDDKITVFLKAFFNGVPFLELNIILFYNY